MTSSNTSAAVGPSQCTALQSEFDHSIPLTRAMQLQVSHYSQEGLILTAPLEPNRNDKGSAFGGSLSALLTLSGWGLLWLKTRQQGLACDLVIHRGEIRYRRPVHGSLKAVCEQPSEPDWRLFCEQFSSRGKARIRLKPVILDSQGQEAVTFPSEFVALKKESK